MSKKDDNVEAARKHYEDRKNGRPKQTWNEQKKEWEKS
jgi:hypothetical protein